jgi:uncharacterized protein (DUF2267 family)
MSPRRQTQRASPALQSFPPPLDEAKEDADVETAGENESDPTQLDRATALFYDRIERMGPLPFGVDAADATTAVLCTLSQRLSGGEAFDFAASLPPDLQAAIGPCTVHRGEAGKVFGQEQFLGRVADHLSISSEDAAAVTRQVFAAVQDQLSSKETRDVESQLPEDLKVLWRQG